MWNFLANFDFFKILLRKKQDFMNKLLKYSGRVRIKTRFTVRLIRNRGM